MSAPARTALREAVAGDGVYVSAISAWEVALLVQRGRLELTMDADDWIAASSALPFFHFVPVEARVAAAAARLPGAFHADPADRIIVATARSLGATLLTKDDRIRAYSEARTLW